MNQIDHDKIHALWDDLSAFGGARPDEALLSVLGSLAALVDASNAYWLVAVRMQSGRRGDPALGWRPRCVEYLSGWSEREAVYREQCRRVDSGIIDPSIIANLADAGRFRVNTQSQLVGPEWYTSEYYQKLFAAVGVRDVLYAAMPLGADIECWLGFERTVVDPPHRFGYEEREIIAYAVRPLRWFHHRLLLHRGIGLARSAVTNAERRVLDLLLSELTEHEIAAELSLSPATVHTYSTRIYRKFNVRGRTGLVALWLGAY